MESNSLISSSVAILNLMLANFFDKGPNGKYLTVFLARSLQYIVAWKQL